MSEREHWFPHPDRDAYPAHAGPPAWYPCESSVSPVWVGSGRRIPPPDFSRTYPDTSEPESPAPVATSVDGCQPSAWPGVVSDRWDPVPGTGFGWTDCACGVPVIAVEDQREKAKCMECARSEITWPWFTPEGSWHPTVGYSGPGSGPPWPGPWPGAPATADPGPFPAPVVTSTAGHELVAWPVPVLQLRERVEAAGWNTLLQHANGWMPHATTGRPGAGPRASVALRMRRGDQGAVAVYRMQSKGWAWDLFYVWSPAQPWTKLKTLAAFEEAVGAVP